MRRYHFVGPQWSADGESLVVEARPNGTSAGLISVDVQNGEISPLIRNASEGVVEWVTGAPKGKAYFVRHDAEGGATGRGRIVERNMSTGDERPVYRYESQVAGGSPIRHLAVSWDGIHLAFLERIGGVPTALSVLDVNGGKPERVFSVEAGKVLYRPAWTPDGSILVGVGTAIGPDSQLELWKVEPKTALAKRLKGESLAGRSMGGLSVHPDGKKIIFTAARIFSEGDELLAELLRVEDVKMK